MCGSSVMRQAQGAHRAPLDGSADTPQIPYEPNAWLKAAEEQRDVRRSSCRINYSLLDCQPRLHDAVVSQRGERSGRAFLARLC